MKQIFIVDDDVAVTNYFKVMLAQTGIYETTVENDSRNVIDLLTKESFDLILLDMDMPNVSGMDILKEMKEMCINVPVIVLTGVNDVDLAVKSMKVGVFDYLIKPVDDDKLLEIINDALEHSDLDMSIKQLPRELSRQGLVNRDAFDYLVTSDPEMIRLFHQAEKLADSDLTLFIWGESGTGKETLARAIHKASPRRNKPFVAVEANSFTQEQFPAFFFGQARSWSKTREEKTGFLEEADGGTLFLNHIEYLDFPMQARLKRVIQRNEYYLESSARIRRSDVRIIVSSTKDLLAPEKESSFSRDLIYHLMVTSIRIPPLRERVDDIMLLASHFLSEETSETGKDIKGFSDESVELLKNYSYPNNVQELITIVASAVAKEGKDIITAESLPSILSEEKKIAELKGKDEFKIRKLDDVIVEEVKKTLDYFGGDKKKSAEKLGITVKKINQIIKKIY
ncbi:MAG: sigma-54 dependent transcriptional regulator [Candidatus Krumholzibacteriota bacterium]|nr:sigma-54 dependent transcriptional regulator [Candidatus Krumholzibacteriota bacterium]